MPEKVRRWTENDHALKLETPREDMGQGQPPEFLLREELSKNRLIRLPEALISSIYLSSQSKRGTQYLDVTQQVWNYFLEKIDYGQRGYLAQFPHLTPLVCPHFFLRMDWTPEKWLWFFFFFKLFGID